MDRAFPGYLQIPPKTRRDNNRDKKKYQKRINANETSHAESELSTDSEYDPTEESLAERLAALKDIVPPTTRGWLSAKVSAVTGFGSSSFWFAGKALWFVSSTALMLGVPFAVCVMEESQVVAMEQEYKMREMGSEALTEGGDSTADKVGAALGTEEKKGGIAL